MTTNTITTDTRFVPESMELWVYPGSYIGPDYSEFYCVLGQHRDSDVLTRSNYIRAKEMLEAVVKKLGDAAWKDDECLLQESSASHWAVGWVEGLLVHKDAPEELLREADEIVAALQDYPVLDESHFSDMEYEEMCAAWENMNLRDRIELCVRCRISIFAARRDELPEDDQGMLRDYLTC
jgi:hypothetical protein